METVTNTNTSPQVQNQAVKELFALLLDSYRFLKSNKETKNQPLTLTKTNYEHQPNITK